MEPSLAVVTMIWLQLHTEGGQYQGISRHQGLQVASLHLPAEALHVLL